jgi:hypothetical protein
MRAALCEEPAKLGRHDGRLALRIGLGHVRRAAVIEASQFDTLSVRQHLLQAGERRREVGQALAAAEQQQRDP